MEDNLVRCRQRFSNYEKSLNYLKTTVEKESLNDIEKAGLIQFFEVTLFLDYYIGLLNPQYAVLLKGKW